MYKKILVILLLGMLILSGCSEKNHKIDLYESIIQKDKMIVGMSFNAKPFGFQDKDGKITGLEADLAKEIAKRLLGSKDKVVFRNITPQDRIKAALSGDVDMIISTMTITRERKKLVTFSEPYFVAGQVICVKKGSKIDSFYDLMNKKIIVIISSTSEKNIKHLAPNALIQGYSDHAQAFDAFKNAFGDAMTTDDALLQGFVLENKGYIILPEKLTKEPYGIAFKKSKQTQILKKNIDEILEDIKHDGTLDNIKEKWGIT